MIDTEKLESLRKSKGFTQNSFSRKLGITQNGYLYILKNKDTKASTLKKIAEYFDVPIDYLFNESYYEYNNISNSTNKNGTFYSDQQKRIKQATKDKEIELLTKQNEYLNKENDLLKSNITDLKEQINFLRKLVNK